MINLKLSLISTALILATVGQVSAESHGAEHQLFNYMPEAGYQSTSTRRYVEASTQNIISADEQIADIYANAIQGETLVQRISENAYWVFLQNYATTFYVGEKGVLLLDPLSPGQSKQVLEAIASVTDKPLTAIVYSHAHADHISGINVYLEDAKKKNIDIEVIATNRTALKLRFINSGIPAPTRLLSFDNDSMKFDNVTLSVVGFEHGSHTEDSAMWFLEEEGVLHIPDYINPDQLPYLGFALAEQLIYFRNNLELMLEKEWTVMNAGHGNIGTKEDVRYLLTYMDDMKEALISTFPKVDMGKILAANLNSHQAIALMARDEHVRLALDVLRPKYGDIYGFEATAPAGADVLRNMLYLYR